jgi:hypothetical protein
MKKIVLSVFLALMACFCFAEPAVKVVKPVPAPVAQPANPSLAQIIIKALLAGTDNLDNTSL